MAYFTKSEARAAASKTRGQRNFAMESAEILLDSVKNAKGTDQFDVFLSHSIADAEIVLGIKQLLEERGLKVYVDWVEDKQLGREAVTMETAEALRLRMRQSTFLIYLSSDSSSSSKWMPWELGYFDGFKLGSVAIMPVLDSPTDTFKGQEYLGLYPVVQKETCKDGRLADVFFEERGVRRSLLKSSGEKKPTYMEW